MTTTSPTATLTLANCFVFVDDVDRALEFYRDILGFTVTTDVTNEGFRWTTVATPTQPELGLTIQVVGAGMPMSDDDKQAASNLMAKGLLTALIFTVDDVDALFEHVRAAGAEVISEPADQFYGVRDCAFRDPSGNMVRFNTPLPDQES